jgi:hypothetical protein
MIKILKIFKYSKLTHFQKTEKGISVFSSLDYLNPTDACQTNASKRNSTGIAVITSTIGRNAV